jgi:hypothetical protein
VTIGAYYKGFKSLFGSVAAALGALPLVSELLGDKISAYCFPPLGDTFRVATLVACGIVTLVVYQAHGGVFVRSAKGRFAITIRWGIVTAVGLVAFVASTMAFVRTTDVPATGESVSLVVGYTRSADARASLSAYDDWEALRRRGPTDDQVYWIWTKPSVIVARTVLFGCYLVFLLAAVTVCSLSVLYEQLGPP